MPDETLPVEGAEGQEAAQPTIEEIAAAQGWNPDHDGPDKIDAAEFVRRKPLFDKIKAQNKELREVKKLVEGMATTYKTMSEAQFKKGSAAAEERMRAAEAEFDVKAYKEASHDKQQLEAAQSSTVTATEPPEVTEFCEKNPWFEKNAVMRTDALDYREKYLKANPNAPIADVLEYISTKIKRDYPEAFEPTEKKRATPSAVEGASASSVSDPLSKLKASMSTEEKRIMKMFVGEGSGKMTEKEYLESYSTVRER